MMLLYIGIIIVLAGLMWRMHYLHNKHTAMLMERHTVELLENRADAIKRSKAVTRGQLSEHMIPIFPGFPYSASDCKFSGQPVDYLVFKGMNDLRDGKESIVEIVFADVKVGTAQRTKVQNAIKRAVEQGRVRWETWRIDDNNKIHIK